MTTIIDCREYDGNIDLEIKLASGKISKLSIKDLKSESDAMNSIMEYNINSDKSSKARCHAGDAGFMYTYGLFNAKMAITRVCQMIWEKQENIVLK